MDEGKKREPKLEELISLREAAQLSGFTQGYLRRLLRNNVFWGIKIGRNWLTSKDAVRNYLATERKRGRPKDTR